VTDAARTTSLRKKENSELGGMALWWNVRYDLFEGKRPKSYGKECRNLRGENWGYCNEMETITGKMLQACMETC
jgi:hypothetical protein